MNLIEFDKENIEVIYSPLLLTLKPFKDLIDRDKSKKKELAVKEISFIAFYADIRSMYMYITDDQEREEELIKDLELPKKWKKDSLINIAIDFYKQDRSINSILYSSACKSALDVAQYLQTTDALLKERDDNGKVVTDINKITAALEKVPKIMSNLNVANEELIKEQKITEGRNKGARTFNMFEDGIGLDDE